MDYPIIDTFWFNRIFLALVAMIIAEARGSNKFFWGIFVFIVSLFYDVGTTPQYSFWEQRIIIAFAGIIVAYVKGFKKLVQLLKWFLICGVFHILALLYLIIVVSPAEKMKEEEIKEGKPKSQ
jgi:hypothetical protein